MKFPCVTAGSSPAQAASRDGFRTRSFQKIVEDDGSGGGASSVWAPKPDVHPRRSTAALRRSWRTTTARSASSGSSSTVLSSTVRVARRAGGAQTRPGGASWEGRSRSGLLGGGRRGDQSFAGDVVLCGDVHDGQTSPSGDGGGVLSTSNSTSTTSRCALVARLLDQVPDLAGPGVGELELAQALLDVRG